MQEYNLTAFFTFSIFIAIIFLTESRKKWKISKILIFLVSCLKIRKRLQTYCKKTVKYNSVKFFLS